MIRLHLVFVGKTAFPEVEQAVRRYLERLRRYVSVQVHVIKAEKIGEPGRDDWVRGREGERMLRLVGPQDTVVVLDRLGEQWDSEKLAAYLDELNRRGTCNVWLAVGGPVGHSRQVLERADLILALSRICLLYTSPSPRDS